MVNDSVFAVLAAYADMDRATAAFQASTDLACPPGCGACCHSVKVQATVLEFLPLAVELCQRGEAQQWLDMLATAPDAPCVLFVPDPAHPEGGRCAHYAWRPTLCRLFGFAAVRDKNGNAVLSVCRRLSMAAPLVVASARAAVASGTVTAPLFADFAQCVAGIDPHYGTEQLPVNRAFEAALGWASLRAQVMGLPAPDAAAPILDWPDRPHRAA